MKTVYSEPSHICYIEVLEFISFKIVSMEITLTFDILSHTLFVYFVQHSLDIIFAIYVLSGRTSCNALMIQYAQLQYLCKLFRAVSPFLANVSYYSSWH